MKKELTIQELSEKYSVEKNFIYQLRHKGLDYKQIVDKLRKVNSTEYKIKLLLNLYVKLYMNLIKINYKDPDKRKQIKARFFESWKEENLPFTEHVISVGWSKIARNVYLQMD